MNTTISDQCIFELGFKFDRLDPVKDKGKFVKVTRDLPDNVKLSEVVGLSHGRDKTTRISVLRGDTTYLCVCLTKTVKSLELKWKQEMAKRIDTYERWEHWEVNGSEKPIEKFKQIINSRSTKKEQDKLWSEYEI